MEKIKEKLKGKLKDEVATSAILIAVFVTVIANMGIYTFLNNRKSVEAGSTADKNGQIENATIKDLTSVENINSVEELKKLNEKELEEAKKKKKEENEIISTPKYYIKVNYGAQVVTIYAKDSNGEYTKPVKAMVCSTGTYTPTSGIYETPNRFRWLDMVGDVYAQYCTQIVGDILFHSVPYSIKYDHSSLIYSSYDKLGTRCSLGCIRLTCEDAKWIYDNCKLGTQVEFYSSSNPGPLGKPSARKVSSAPANIRGWDPTDPDDDNPWKEYLKKQEEKDKNKDKDKDKDKENDKDKNENKKEDIIEQPVKPDENPTDKDQIGKNPNEEDSTDKDQSDEESTDKNPSSGDLTDKDQSDKEESDNNPPNEEDSADKEQTGKNPTDESDETK